MTYKTPITAEYMAGDGQQIMCGLTTWLSWEYSPFEMYTAMHTDLAVGHSESVMARRASEGLQNTDRPSEMLTWTLQARLGRISHGKSPHERRRLNGNNRNDAGGDYGTVAGGGQGQSRRKDIKTGVDGADDCRLNAERCGSECDCGYTSCTSTAGIDYKEPHACQFFPTHVIGSYSRTYLSTDPLVLAPDSLDRSEQQLG